MQIYNFADSFVIMVFFDVRNIVFGGSKLTVLVSSTLNILHLF
jgi:hypothetical protein